MPLAGQNGVRSTALHAAAHILVTETFGMLDSVGPRRFRQCKNSEGLRYGAYEVTKWLSLVIEPLIVLDQGS